MEKKLTSRQWKLYNFLKDNGSRWVTQKEIAIALSLDYPATESDMEDFHNCNARHLITNDIRALNKSSVIQKIILSGVNGIKIANEEEFYAFIAKRFSQVISKLNYIKTLSEKGSRNGQIRIKLGKYERDTIEAFIEVN